MNIGDFVIGLVVIIFISVAIQAPNILYEWAESLTPKIRTHSIKINNVTYLPTEDDCINQSRQKCDKTILVLWKPKEK